MRNRRCSTPPPRPRPGSPRLFPAGNVAADFTLGYGDTETAFRQAAHVVETEVEIGRHTGVPLEPRVLLAEPDPRTGGLSIFGMTKVPVFNRDLLATMLGMDQALIHVHAIDAGGGFGVRGEFYPEDFLVPWLARTLGRPVKWAEDRAEHLVAANHSRQQSHRVAAAFDDRGRITALTDEVVHDNGAYCRTHGIAVPELTVAMLPGPYRVPAYRRPGPGGAHQQDAVRHLPGTRPVRGHHRARAAARRRRRPAGHRPDRAAAPQPAGPGRASAPPPHDHPRHRRGAGRRGLPGAARRPRRPRWPGSATTRRPGERAHRPPARARRRRLPREERARAARDRRRHRQRDRRGAGAVRRDVAGAGHRDGARPDRRGRARRRPAGRGRGQRGHRPAAVRHRVVGFPVDGGGRERGAQRRVRGQGARAAARRPDAGGGRGRPGGHRRHRQRPRRPGGFGQPRRDRPGGRPGQPLPAARRARGAGRAAPFRRGAHDLSVRGARRPGRGRPRYRAGACAAVPRGQRGGTGDQPGAGGGAAPRRGGAGHRRGAAGGVQLRRGGPAAGDHVHGVPAADRRRDPADRRPAGAGRPRAGQPARRHGRGRGRHQRRGRGGGERRARRAGPGRQRRPAAADAAAGARAGGGRAGRGGGRGGRAETGHERKPGLP